MPRRFALVILLVLSLIGNVRIVHAAPSDPTDAGFGLSFDGLTVEVPGYSPPAAGLFQAIVARAKWSDGRPVDGGVTVALVHWPRGDGDTARAIDPWSFDDTDPNGYSVLVYPVPIEVLRPGEDVVTATVEISVLAFRMSTWPNAGFGRAELSIPVKRIQEDP